MHKLLLFLIISSFMAMSYAVNPPPIRKNNSSSLTRCEALTFEKASHYLCEHCVSSYSCYYCISERRCKNYRYGVIFPSMEECSPYLVAVNWGTCLLSLRDIAIFSGVSMTVLLIVVPIACCCHWFCLARQRANLLANVESGHRAEEMHTLPSQRVLQNTLENQRQSILGPSTVNSPVGANDESGDHLVDNSGKQAAKRAMLEELKEAQHLQRPEEEAEEEEESSAGSQSSGEELGRVPRAEFRHPPRRTTVTFANSRAANYYSPPAMQDVESSPLDVPPGTGSGQKTATDAIPPRYSAAVARTSGVREDLRAWEERFPITGTHSERRRRVCRAKDCSCTETNSSVTDTVMCTAGQASRYM